MDALDGFSMKGRDQSKPGFNPTFENRASNGITVKQPAAQKSEIAVFQAFLAAARRFLLPLMELKGYVHEVMKACTSQFGIVDFVCFSKKLPRDVICPLNLQALRVAVEVP